MVDTLDTVKEGLKALFLRANGDLSEEKMHQHLQLLFVTRVNQRVQQRKARNQALACFQIKRSIWIVSILSYLQLDEQLACKEWCTQMQTIIHSNFYVKFQLASQVQVPPQKPKPRGKVEDLEAQVEMTKTVNQFLTLKLKQNEQVVITQQKDIQILKDVYNLDKNVASKREALLRRSAQDLQELRESSLQQHALLRDQLQEISLKEQTLEAKCEQLQQETDVILQQRNRLRQENVVLQSQLQQSETMAEKHRLALESLQSFFRQTTMAKVQETLDLSESSNSIIE